MNPVSAVWGLSLCVVNPSFPCVSGVFSRGPCRTPSLCTSSATPCASVPGGGACSGVCVVVGSAVPVSVDRATGQPCPAVGGGYDGCRLCGDGSGPGVVLPVVGCFLGAVEGGAVFGGGCPGCWGVVCGAGPCPCTLVG